MSTPTIFTPYLKPLQKNATTIVFKSADNQLSYLAGSTGRHSRFSKYALLNLPDIVVPSNNANKIQFGTIEGAYIEGLSTTPGSAGDNIDLAQSLQNYALNMESILLGNPNYDNTTHQTVSERVFFKWLKELGALRWVENTANKATTVTDKRFAEKPENTNSMAGDIYSQVINFIGEIDIQGDLQSNYGSKQQVYFYIPSHVGSTPKVLFKNVIDDNYHPAMIIRQQDNTNIEFIQGSDSNDNPSPAGLSVAAFYDLDVAAGSLAYTVNTVTQNSWFDQFYDPAFINSYLTDADADDVTDDLITRENLDTTNHIEWLRSRLDCVQIDFDPSNYKAFEDDGTLKSFMDYNTSNGAKSFGFNAIAMYYDVIENGVVLATNLYGITFIGDLSPVSGSGSTFKSLYKQKPDTILGISGNGYGLILNLVRDGNNNIDNTVVNVSINDYNTFSMQLFTQAMLQMGALTQNFERVLLQNNDIQKRFLELEGLLVNSTDRVEILGAISDIRTQLGDVGTNTQLTALVNKLYDTMNQILLGKTSVPIDLLFNIIGLNGIEAKQDTQNSILYIDDKKEKYLSNFIINLDIDSDQSIESINNFQLVPKNSIFIHRNDAIDKVLFQHIYIRIDESVTGWATNQSIEFFIDDDIDLNGKSIYVATGTAGAYDLINVITKPTKSFEIICLDSNKRDFILKT